VMRGQTSGNKQKGRRKKWSESRARKTSVVKKRGVSWEEDKNHFVVFFKERNYLGTTGLRGKITA